MLVPAVLCDSYGACALDTWTTVHSNSSLVLLHMHTLS